MYPRAKPKATNRHADVCVEGVGEGLDRSLLEDVDNYSPFGLKSIAANFSELSSLSFAQDVVEPIGINCESGGTRGWLYCVITGQNLSGDAGIEAMFLHCDQPRSTNIWIKIV